LLHEGASGEGDFMAKKDTNSTTEQGDAPDDELIRGVEETDDLTEEDDDDFDDDLEDDEEEEEGGI
jgi:hypothetical protein